MGKALRNADLWTITAGATLFVAVLLVAAYWDRDIRWLHFLQGWMYVAAVALSWRRSRWGYFIGFGAAALWNDLTLFVNSFLENGLEQAAMLLHSGHVARPDLFIAVPGWLGNLLVIVGCVWAYARLPRKRWADAGRVLVATAATTAFFALAMYVSQPRYLAQFPRMLHPHVHL